MLFYKRTPEAPNYEPKKIPPKVTPTNKEDLLPRRREKDHLIVEYAKVKNSDVEELLKKYPIRGE